MSEPEVDIRASNSFDSVEDDDIESEPDDRGLLQQTTDSSSSLSQGKLLLGPYLSCLPKFWEQFFPKNYFGAGWNILPNPDLRYNLMNATHEKSKSRVCFTNDQGLSNGLISVFPLQGRNMFEASQVVTHKSNLTAEASMKFNVPTPAFVEIAGKVGYTFGKSATVGNKKVCTVWPTALMELSETGILDVSKKLTEMIKAEIVQVANLKEDDRPPIQHKSAEEVYLVHTQKCKGECKVKGMAKKVLTGGLKKYEPTIMQLKVPYGTLFSPDGKAKQHRYTTKCPRCGDKYSVHYKEWNQEKVQVQPSASSAPSIQPQVDPEAVEVSIDEWKKRIPTLTHIVTAQVVGAFQINESVDWEKITKHEVSMIFSSFGKSTQDNLGATTVLSMGTNDSGTAADKNANVPLLLVLTPIDDFLKLAVKLRGN